MENRIQTLYKILCSKRINALLNESIAPYTTFKIGGDAAILIKAVNSADLVYSVNACIEHHIPFTIIGKGSNILVSDDGLKAAVIINNSSNWEVLSEKLPESIIAKKLESRYIRLEEDSKHMSDYSSGEGVVIRADSGVSIGTLRNQLFREKIYGLEWFAGIPSSVGGALYVNMHGADMYFGDLVYRAKLFDGKEFKIVDNSYFEFAYDYSYLQKSKELVIWVDMMLKRGDVSKAMNLAKQWSKQKSIQPQKSAGCVFQNLSKEEMARLDLPTPSVGYLIDKVLGLKGISAGGAKISEKHAAFIENTGNASAEDVFSLIQLIKKEAKNKLGLDLRMEIELKGDFNKIK